MSSTELMQKQETNCFVLVRLMLDFASTFLKTAVSGRNSTRYAAL